MALSQLDSSLLNSEQLDYSHATMMISSCMVCYILQFKADFNAQKLHYTVIQNWFPFAREYLDMPYLQQVWPMGAITMLAGVMVLELLWYESV